MREIRGSTGPAQPGDPVEREDRQQPTGADASAEARASGAPGGDPSEMPGPRLFGRSTGIALLITVVLLGAMAYKLDVRAVWAEVSRADKSLLLLGMLAHYMTYPVRGMRWHRGLRHLNSKATWGRFSLIVFFYNFVDNVVPAKLGDVYGAHLVKINLGLRRSAALGSMVFLRMIDAWVVLGVAAFSSWIIFADQLPKTVVNALLVGIVVAVVASLVILTFALMHKLPVLKLSATLRPRIEAFRSGMWPARREYLAIGFLTLVIWALETLWILCLALAFGLSPTVGELLFLTMIPLLASTFPLTPSGAGVVELTLFGCLRAVGVAAVPAASITLVNRVIDYWLHIALGLITWALRERFNLRTWREVELSDDDDKDTEDVQFRASECA